MPPQPQQSRERFIEELFNLQKPDNFKLGTEARKGLIDGIKKGYNALKPAYGPNGSDVVIRTDLYPFNETTNDGKKILDALQLTNPYETSGLDYMREVANETDKESGDGRKTSALTFAGIVIEGEKVDASLSEIRSSLNDCLPIIINSIDSQTQKVTVKDIAKVASTASESEELGKIFQEIYSKIGKDGIIELDNSGISDTFYETTEGVRLLNCGFTYPYMANEDKGRKAVYKSPYVLITKQKISGIKDLNRIFLQVKNKGKDELVIFCDEIDLPVSQGLAMLHQGTMPDGTPLEPFKVLVIKAPTLWKDWLYEDFAKITGATILDPMQGRNLANFQFSWLGYCDKIITSKNETVVLGIQDIKEHLAKLSEENTDDGKIRIARLQTKTAILKLGANSETELSRLRGKALDGRNSAFLALQGGVVEGAGLSLVKAAKELPDTVGGRILKKALLYPNNILGDKKTDVLDAAIVLKTAVTHALSVGTTVLTTDTVVLQRK